ncbi:Caspase domain-containing protein [Methylophilus rhizosphaerae]|uniref:Caspase domain-containing protein n=1 Tax=Methylophilus rhizosphaerae TaxID=492660 RepID=A0A1G9B8J8_9PROT|nr:caspase family protein [Methylophilus rhizosphaerae]SDK35350.1 Caspase domain-containing protein [Methylophilus rhizosphaerae]
MKRKALLIANTNGLEGVKVDITKFSAFLKSNLGGAWFDSEIQILANESKVSLLRKVDELKRQSNDYTIVLFSGHGGYQRRTVLEINGNGETIQENELANISKRQLNIYDCCRSIIPESTVKAAMDSMTVRFAESVNTYRQKFDSRIMQADEQLASLYSCSIGQVSYDTSNGGVYLSKLLDAAKNVSTDFKLVSTAHDEARTATILESKLAGRTQVPDAVLAKSMSYRQLIISLSS